MHTILYPVNSVAHAGAEQQLLALVRGPDDLGRVPMAQVVGEGLGAIILLRLLPALNIPDADIAEALARLDQAATSLAQAA